MGKLHELLAVEADRKKASDRLVAESIKTFSKKNLFSGAIKRTEMFDDEEQKVSDEVLKLETTVDENLEYSLNALVKYWDTVAQKDSTNMIAVADIIINGKVLVAGVPATTLLGMEKKINELRNLYNAIPTLDPGINWQIDSSQEKKGVYKNSNNLETFRTMKAIQYKTVAEPTKEHPAQVREVTVTKNIGKFITTKWSGMITPYEKARRITNIETILSAVKKARQRANSVKTVDLKVGQAIIDFINN